MPASPNSGTSRPVSAAVASRYGGRTDRMRRPAPAASSQ